jgi:diguanylate cyclase (GGDEF)-like protein/PAS domain S-box-containing protein
MPSVRRKISLNRLPLWVAAFVALICIAILGLSGAREWSSRAADLKNAEVGMANLARSLAQHAEDSFDLLDASIIGIVSRLEIDGTGAVASVKFQKVLEARKAGLSRIHGIVIYDETGRPVATSGSQAGNVSDRGYFRHHLQSTDRDLWIGPPIRSNASGEWIITLSRRFNHPDGSFAGVVLATIGSAYFTEFYRQFDSGANSTITLLSTDGVLLARSPDDGSYVGRDMSNLPLFRDASLQAPGGTYHFQSPLDGSERISFYRRSDRFPFVILAAMQQSEVLAEWRKNATARMGFVLALSLLIAIFGFFLVRQLHLRQRLVSALVAKEADFRLLAEQSSDMVTRVGLDQRILYVSPASLRVVGWRPDQLIGTPALAGVNPQDLPGVNATMVALRRGDIVDARLVYRSRHRERHEVWIESSMRVTRRLDTGEIDGAVAISRDVTERKNAEQKLADLAVLDGLTALANRRRFDERLQEEWARAHRDGETLSLLMIDVDRFKEFNDHYGHPAGDLCLKSIAKVLAGEARRPADLAARYGGEEFAVLLPNTDAAGCERIGETIRNELQALHIRHATNFPSMCVTVSLGGATVRPEAEDPMASASLVEAADQALYAAKRGGRNRLIMSVPTVASLAPA